MLKYINIPFSNIYDLEFDKEDFILISVRDINNRIDDYKQTNIENKHFKDKFVLYVHDCKKEDIEEDEGLDDMFLFNKYHAFQLLRFVEEYKDIQKIYIHCALGISRSAGIAKALDEIYNDGKYKEHYEKNARPSEHIYNVIIKTKKEYDNCKAILK